MTGFWRSAWQWLGTSPSVAFSEPEPDPQPVDRLIVKMAGQGASFRVGRIEALSVPAVLRGRNLICSISTLPLVQYDRQNKPVRNPLFEQIDPDVPNVVTLAQTIEDLLFEGIAWWLITEFDANGFPRAARHLDVSLVSLDPPTDGRSPSPLPSGEEPRGATVWVDGVETSADRVIRFDSPNPGLLKAGGGRPIRRAILLDSAAAMYADEPRPLDYFTPSEGADPADDADIEEVLEKWKEARKKRGTAYVPAALRYNAVDQPTPADLQLVELQKRAALDIANALGLDPEDLGISTTSRTYQNATDRRQDRINDVLSPYMRAITDRLSMGDVTRRGHRVAFDLDDYMRADPRTRWDVYEKQHRMFGDAILDEIRDEERMPPLPATATPAAPVVPLRPVAVPVDDKQVAAARPATAQFDSDERAETELTFAGVPAETFAVDGIRRTVTGLAVPYGQIASKGGRRWRFLPGSLTYSDVSRVKLLRDHVYSTALGRAVELRDTPDGLVATFKVARGDDGDRALALAEDGVLDGLSIGVDIVDAVPDPNNRGVLLVRRAVLREVSLTAMPAFDDSRLTSVVASRDEGVTMTDATTEPQAPAAPAAAPDTGEQGGLTLNQDQVTALLARPGALDALIQRPAAPAEPATPPGALVLSADQVDGLIRSGGLATLLGVPQLGPTRTEQAEQRTTVNPNRPKASVSLTEEAPYRFDRQGNLSRGRFDFSTDLIAGSQGDAGALERAQAFMREQFDSHASHAQFDVDKADVSALNPSRNRPDMYVDQREFRSPIWEAINKGTIADSTPFVLPKFSSASGLVSNHTEGTEPTAGTYVATSQTITPTAVSGKVEVTRESWEQGGNPQLSSIIWRQMVRAWYEALEAAAVAVLDAATPASIALTAGGGTTGQTLDAELTAAFAQLQFVRGGFSMTDMFAQIDLYKALVAAKDTTGRRLYPALGPSNASGVARSRYAAIDVNGVTALPAWALAASGSVTASSYLFDRDSVHGWASAPQRLQFEYRVAYVDVAIWGYKATAITDINGVREITYDPVA